MGGGKWWLLLLFSFTFKQIFVIFSSCVRSRRVHLTLVLIILHNNLIWHQQINELIKIRIVNVSFKKTLPSI